MKRDYIRRIAKSSLSILLCLGCVAGLSFSWFRKAEYIGGSMQYTKYLMIGNARAEVTTYLGEETSRGSGEYVYNTPVDSNGFEVTGLYPTARQYFKTHIENTSGDPTDVMSFGVYLLGIRAPRVLAKHIIVNVTSPYNVTERFPIEENAEGADPSEIRTLERVCFVDRVTLDPIDPADTNEFGEPNAQNNSVDIYWSVEIDSAAGNECINTAITLSSIQLQS